jgi:hypothetical protein
MRRTGHQTRDVFDRYNIWDEQDDRRAAWLLAGRLDVALAVTAAESKSTTGRKSALRLVRSGRSSAEVRWWTILDLNQ